MDAMIRELEALKRRVAYLETLENGRWVWPHDTIWVGTANTPLTSTDWTADAFSTTAKTLIDLSVVFGVPAGVHAVYMRVNVNDSGSAANDTYLILSPNDTAASGMAFSPYSVNDRVNRTQAIIPCNSDGDIYYQISASGAGTFDVTLQVWGYEL